MSVARPQIGHERHEQDRRAGAGTAAGPRRLGRRSARGAGRRPASSRCRAGSRRRRPASRCGAFRRRKAMGLPHEMVVVAVAAGQPEARPGRAPTSPAPTSSAGSDRASRTRTRGDGSRRRPLLRSQPPHRSLETDPVLTGPAIGEPDPGRAAPSRTGSGDAARGILVLLALGLTFRLIIAYLLPGSGFKNRPRLVPVLGEQARRRTGLYGFYERGFFHDYTPGLPVRPVARGRGREPARRCRRPDQDPADPRRPRARLPRLVDDRASSAASERAARIGARDRPAQPGHLVRQRRLGPGRLGRASSSCCWRCASCGATGPSARRSSRRSPRSSSRSSGSSSRSSRSS